MIKWAREHGCPWEEDIDDTYMNWCARAAYGGHLEMLQWPREHHCPWNHLTRQYAEEQGHLELLQWAVEHGAPM